MLCLFCTENTVLFFKK
uniref:Uncharacterized protein n=1 Tax=Rhizophora mucronata TaxID=61149 RepID=A0A2P2M4B8_RHIMU